MVKSKLLLFGGKFDNSDLTLSRGIQFSNERGLRSARVDFVLHFFYCFRKSRIGWTLARDILLILLVPVWRLVQL